MIYQLAQAVAEVAEQATFLGLNADHWTILIPAILTFLATVIPLWRSSDGAKGKLNAVVHAVAETLEKNPEAGSIVKKAIQAKAEKLGVEAGLNKDVEKVKALRKNGGKV